jgi:hypothetical protein
MSILSLLTAILSSYGRCQLSLLQQIVESVDFNAQHVAVGSRLILS